MQHLQPPSQHPGARATVHIASSLLDKPGQEASDCPQPRPQDKRPKKTKPARVKHVTPAAKPLSSPAVPTASVVELPVKPAVNAVSAAHKGSAVWSVHSTNSEAALKATSPFVV